VVLAKTAKLIGDVVHQTLAVEPGAFFEGQCRRIDGAKT
jgi:cytoskeletal protein CcmA (bactofilin family)